MDGSVFFSPLISMYCGHLETTFFYDHDLIERVKKPLVEVAMEKSDMMMLFIVRSKQEVCGENAAKSLPACTNELL